MCSSKKSWTASNLSKIFDTSVKGLESQELIRRPPAPDTVQSIADKSEPDFFPSNVWVSSKLRRVAKSISKTEPFV